MALRRYAFMARIAARQQLTYRSEFVLRAVSMVIFMGIFMALWRTVYTAQGVTSLSGYTLTTMLWYLAITETIALSTSRIFLEIAETVRSGAVAYTLTRPAPYPLLQLANSLGTTLPRCAINLVTAVIVVGLGVGFQVGSLPGALAALPLDALIAVLIGLLAFWMEEVVPVFWIYQKLLFTVGGLFLPLEFFPDWLRTLSRWLPFNFITYAPARAWVAYDAAFVRETLVGQLLYIGLLALIVAGVWQRARRRLVVQGG